MKKKQKKENESAQKGHALRALNSAVMSALQPFAEAFEHSKEFYLSDDPLIQKRNDKNTITPTHGLNVGYFRRAWEIYNKHA